MVARACQRTLGFVGLFSFLVGLLMLSNRNGWNVVSYWGANLDYNGADYVRNLTLGWELSGPFDQMDPKPANLAAEIFCRGTYNESKADALRSVKKGRLLWTPKKDRYLAAVCQSGQFTNRLICLHKHMMISALLNRTLVWHKHDGLYNYTETLDFPLLLKCLSQKDGYVSSIPTIIFLEEYVQQSSFNNLTIRCLESDCTPWGGTSLIYKWFKKHGLPYHEDSDPNWNVKYGANVDLEAFYEYYKGFEDTRTLAVGDPFGISLKATSSNQDRAKEPVIGGFTRTGSTSSWDFQTWPEKGSKMECSPLLRPHKAIMTAAMEFVRTIIGSSPFMSVHIRRGDFRIFDKSMPSIVDWGICVGSLMKVHPSIRVLFVATNAAPPEILFLREIVEVPILTMNKDILAAQPFGWSADLQKTFGNAWNRNSQVLAMLDKAVCTLSTIFLASPKSSFSNDILRLRRGYGKVHCHDGDPCTTLQHRR